MSVIGLDLGGTKLSGALFSAKGEILKKELLPLERRSGREVGSLIIEMLSGLILHSEKNGIPFKAVGVCIPGISYKETGRVWAPNIPGWEDYHLKKEIVEKIGGGFPVEIDSDRACSILGEKWMGAAKDCRDAIFLAVGTGIGAGIMINENVLRGSNDIAGAVGWLALVRPYYKKYNTCGNFEYNASGEGLVRVAKDYMQDSDYKGPLSDIKELKAKNIFEAYKENDPMAQLVIRNAIEYWGMCTANLVSIFNPQKIVFGGGVFGPALEFLDEIYNESLKWAQPISIKQVKLVPSELGGDAGLTGAGYLALKAAEKEFQNV